MLSSFYPHVLFIFTSRKDKLYSKSPLNEYILGICFVIGIMVMSAGHHDRKSFLVVVALDSISGCGRHSCCHMFVMLFLGCVANPAFVVVTVVIVVFVVLVFVVVAVIVVGVALDAVVFQCLKTADASPEQKQ